MSNNQGFKYRSSPSSSRSMSAFAPFVPDVIPQQPQAAQAPNYQPQQQTPGPAVSESPVVQPSYCVSGTTTAAASASLPRGGHSPDIGYVSLEHPSRSASYVSQVSVQFGSQPGDLSRSSCGSLSFDRTQGRETKTPAKAPREHNGSGQSDVGMTGGHWGGGSQGNVWLARRSKSAFDVGAMQSRTSLPSDYHGNNSRNNIYSRVAGSLKAVDSAAESATKQFQRNGITTAVPSFSSSALSVSDMKNILMVKETELRVMRDTMAKNESAILQVFEDQKRRWQTEMSERRQEWENQLQAAHSRASKAEQVLQSQVAKLNQENRRLLAEADELTNDKKRLLDRCNSLELELEALKTDMRLLLSDVTTTNGDSGDVITGGHHVIDPDRYKIDSNYAEVLGSNPRQRKRPHAEGGPGDPSRPGPPDRSSLGPDARALSLPELQRELETARRDADACRREFERERQGWKAEKEKVIDYQKRLQLSYLQVLHKNRLLELDVQQLTGEMAAIDIRQLSSEENQSNAEEPLH